MTALSFRDACEDDLPAIVAMLADDDLGRGREQTAGPLSSEYKQAFAEIQNANNRIVVAVQENNVVGCLQLTIIPGLSRKGAKRALLEGVRVSSSARGQGIGEQLVGFAIEEAKKAGCRLVQLTSDKRRKRAHAFYERLGFANSHEGFKRELP